MTRRHHLRFTVVAAAAAAALCVGLIANDAAAAGARRTVLGDISSDANGINDGPEGFAQGISTPRSIDEADLRTVETSPLRNRAGRTVGYRLIITTTGRPGTIQATDAPLRYSVLMQLTPDCRIGVSHVAGRGGVLGWSCDNEVLSRTARVASRVRGDRVIIKVPYRLGPDEMRRGHVVGRTEAYTQAAPLAKRSVLPVFSPDIDTALTYQPWTLPR